MREIRGLLEGAFVIRTTQRELESLSGEVQEGRWEKNEKTRKRSSEGEGISGPREVEQPTMNNSKNQKAAEAILYEYTVKLETWEDFTAGGYSKGFGEPATSGAHICSAHSTIEAANRAVRVAIKGEFGGKDQAIQWNQKFVEDGSIRVSAIYINSGNNAKARAWVEKSPR